MLSRINQLLELLNKHTIGELNLLYRDKEVELEHEALIRRPDVWAEPMKKKIIQQAKRKKILEGQKKYLASILEQINGFSYKSYLKAAIEDLERLFNEIVGYGFYLPGLALMHIEFQDYNQNAIIGLYGPYAEKWWENELGSFSFNLNATVFWNFLGSRKFSSLSELLEIVDIDKEEYSQVIVEICELRVFELMRLAFITIGEEPKNIINKIEKLRIEIGMHDCNFYTIYET